MIPTVSKWSFLKGQATGNDFVVLIDPDDALRLEPALIAEICDRHTGIGGDGLIRVVRQDPTVSGVSDDSGAQYFMDYRNADGSLAQMCGNGARLFARVLVEAGLETPGEFSIVTRGGVRKVEVSQAHGHVSVWMGRPDLGSGQHVIVHAVDGPRDLVGTPVWMPNPHAVVWVDDVGRVGPLAGAPQIEDAGAFPDGANVEFVSVIGAKHLRMRVFERGVGETRSCGTGACAVAVCAAIRTDDATSVAPYVIEVPGGQVQVSLRPDGQVVLSGPAEIVASGVLSREWLENRGWQDD